MTIANNNIDFNLLAKQIKQWGKQLGFQQVGITGTNLSADEKRLQEWLQKKYHGEMDYMEKHGEKRSQPSQLVPGTTRIISVRMDYLPEHAYPSHRLLHNKNMAFISRYAVGKDYHKLIRKRLQKLAEIITKNIGQFGYRAFVDSAPVLEKPIARNAGLGWIGKHTNLINSGAGSWFFLGELFTDLPLPLDEPASSHCGTCVKCIDICPTKAIVAPFQLDARKCIAYLTIELRDSIPIEYRKAIGNRIYGCDDCQLVCPWNKFAQYSSEIAFEPKQNLDSIKLIDLFQWTEKEFLKKTEGSAIRRIGYECWLRNISIALGNADYDLKAIELLKKKLPGASPMLQEHIHWAISEQLQKSIT